MKPKWICCLAVITIMAFSACTNEDDELAETPDVEIPDDGFTTGIPDPLPPLAPTSLSASSASSSQVNLTWTDNAADETGFIIQRRTGPGAFAIIATPGVNTSSFSDTGLAPSTTYYYRVAAANDAGNSGYSNEASVTTQAAPITIPSPPSGLSATVVSSTQISLTWTDNSSNEDGFKVERKTGAGGIYALVSTTGAGATSFANTGLSASTIYYYRVRAFNTAGHSSYTNEVNATTQAPPVSVPSAPSALSASAASSSQINLTWTDTSSNESGFRIERKTGTGGTYAEITSVPGNSTSYSNTGLNASTTYYYRVRANNSAGNSGYSNEASATTLAALNVPNSPSGLAAAAVSSSQINLTWTDNSSNETGFQLERKTGAGGAYAQVASLGAGATSYNNTGLSASTIYYYRVRAVNAAGNSAYSNEANATTAAPPATGPEYVVLAANDLGMNVMSQSAAEIMFAPPNNNLRAQVIKRGNPPQIITSGVTVSYSIPGNTQSATKVNFWSYASSILGRSLASNIGITGNGLSGNMTATANGYFEATGIPVTPRMDDGSYNAYPVASVIVKSPAGATLATTQYPTAVSWEIRCSSCHSDATTLSRHDSKFGTNLRNQKPVFCGRCHPQYPLRSINAGSTSYPTLSRAIHTNHASMTGNCFACHPGQTDKYSRDVHFNAGLTCDSCHSTMRVVGGGTRRAWQDEPKCTDCHTRAGFTFEDTGLLYKDSKNHFGISCESCHGSPHAIGPSTVAADNLQAIALQGTSGKINTCTVCHITPPTAAFVHNN